MTLKEYLQHLEIEKNLLRKEIITELNHHKEDVENLAGVFKNDEWLDHYVLNSLGEFQGTPQRIENKITRFIMIKRIQKEITNSL